MAALTESDVRRRGAAAGRRPVRLAAAARKPPHPGMFLETRFLKPLHITQSELALALGISRRRVKAMWPTARLRSRAVYFRATWSVRPPAPVAASLLAIA
jgi:hypothetical protein